MGNKMKPIPLPASSSDIIKEDEIEYSQQQKGSEECPCIPLPGEGRLISEFSSEVSEVLKDKQILFYRPDLKDIVEIGRIKLHKTGKEKYTGFKELKAIRFITLSEKYFTPGNNVYDKTLGWEFKGKSMSAALSAAVIVAENLQQALPQIERIFTVPIPIIHVGKITFPKKGYDERFSSWLPHDSPGISKPDMKLEEAKEILTTLFKEFPFKTKQDATNALAALLTPYLKGLYTKFNKRSPVTFYLANRERVGKEYCAGITGIVHEGNALEESPISSSENARSNHTEELRKKILAAMISGRVRMHFSNNKGFINNAVFEAVVTAERYSDRKLGTNEILTFDNELDFSLSGNTGIGFTPDFANRCRFVNMFLDIEDANSRKFDKPDLHNWVLNNRENILSALYALVRNWFDKGKPKGTIPFASFPEWSEICGGIMEAADLGNPCVPDKDIIALSGDSETTDMKELFELCYEKYPNEWIKKNKIIEIIESEESNIFSYLDFMKKSDQTRFGKKIIKFIGRILSDIRLVVKDSDIRPSRYEYMFTKGDGHIGNVGNLRTLDFIEEEDNKKIIGKCDQSDQGDQRKDQKDQKELVEGYQGDQQIKIKEEKVEEVQQ